MRLTTGLIRSSSEGFVGMFELGTVAECAWTGSVLPTTVGEGRGTAGEGGTAETVGLGASQVPSGTRAAAAAPLTALVLTSFLDEDCGTSVDAAPEGRAAEGTTGFRAVGTVALRIAVMSTFPTGV